MLRVQVPNTIFVCARPLVLIKRGVERYFTQGGGKCRATEELPNIRTGRSFLVHWEEMDAGIIKPSVKEESPAYMTGLRIRMEKLAVTESGALIRILPRPDRHSTSRTSALLQMWRDEP